MGKPRDGEPGYSRTSDAAVVRLVTAPSMTTTSAHRDMDMPANLRRYPNLQAVFCIGAETNLRGPLSLQM